MNFYNPKTRVFTKILQKVVYVKIKTKCNVLASKYDGKRFPFHCPPIPNSQVKFTNTMKTKNYT